MVTRTMLLILPLFLGGCVVLSTEQRAELRRLNDRVASLQRAAESAAVEAAGLKPDLERLSRLISDVWGKVKSGEIPAEEGERLISLYQSRKDDVTARLKSLGDAMTSAREEAARIADAQKRLRDGGVPWWYLAGSVILNLLGAGGGLRVLRKLKTVTKAVGVLSRAGDKVSPDGFGANVAVEVAKAPGIDQAAMRRLHHAARDWQI